MAGLSKEEKELVESFVDDYFSETSREQDKTIDDLRREFDDKPVEAQNYFLVCMAQAFLDMVNG